MLSPAVLRRRRGSPLSTGGGGGGGGATEPSYDEPYSTGDRTADITVTYSTNHVGDVNNHVDGAFGTNTTDSWYFAFQPISGAVLKYQFADPQHITEIRWIQSNASAQGTWRIEASNNNTDWVEMEPAFALGGSTEQIIPLSNADGTGYTYYRFVGITGSASNSPWVQEIEFKTATTS